MDFVTVYRLFLCVLAHMLVVAAADILGSAVRLSNGLSKTEGRVEIYHHGKWGTLCRDDFDINEAYVVCRQLGFFNFKRIKGFGPGHGPIHLSKLKCTGLEQSVLDCEYTNILNAKCTHEQDAGVRCIEAESTGTKDSSYKPIRLADGGSSYEGRIEILHDGRWSTICDDKWDIKDARVACRQLGYTNAIASVPRARFGPGEGTILFSDTSCTGYEKYLNDCPHSEYGVHNCKHGEDAGVICDHLTTKPPDEDFGIMDYLVLDPPLSSLSDSYIYSYDFHSDAEYELQPCRNDKCQNDATCVPLQNNTNFCICKYPWSGNDCEIAGPVLFYPPFNLKNDEDSGKFTELFKDINTYIVFGGFSFLLILSIFIVYAIKDIRQRRRELQHTKTPARV